MTTTFDKREEGFEKQFAHDEELRFKATARRNKLLGLWAAEKLGLTGAEAEAYAKAVVMADFEEPGDHDVLRKSRKDFDGEGSSPSANPEGKMHRHAGDRRLEQTTRSNGLTNGPPSLSPACARAKPCSPPGAACSSRSSRKHSAAKAFRR